MTRFFNIMRNYRFQIWHLILLFLMLISFLTMLSYINNTSTRNLLQKTMNLYRRDSAERMAHLTTASLELFVEHSLQQYPVSPEERINITQAFDIIISQQALQRNLEDICILLESNNEILLVDEGLELYSYLFDEEVIIQPDTTRNREQVVSLYNHLRADLVNQERIHSVMEDTFTFHVFVPFLPRGELVGAVYMQVVPDFSKLVAELSSTHDETGALFSAVILLGLLAMFYITSYTVQQRDQVAHELYQRKEEQLTQEIEHQKEALFTRRIYHTHHKAEKVMGFIKEDLRLLDEENLDRIKQRVSKYANFVSRVIYDMKSYDPPLHVIRNPIFQTDINEVIQFIVDNIFRRVYREGELYGFDLHFDPDIPVVAINEYVIWAIVEPLIQNVIDHNSNRYVNIRISTSFDPKSGNSLLEISDDGEGINAELLSSGKMGIQRLFRESTSTKDKPQNAGYGSYIAYEFCRRCGWRLYAENSAEGGASLHIEIPGKGDA